MASEMAKRMFQLEQEFAKLQTKIICMKQEVESQIVRGQYSCEEKNRVNEALKEMIEDLAEDLQRTENSIAWEIGRQIEVIKK